MQVLRKEHTFKQQATLSCLHINYTSIPNSYNTQTTLIFFEQSLPIGTKSSFQVTKSLFSDTPHDHQAPWASWISVPLDLRATRHHIHSPLPPRISLGFPMRETDVCLQTHLAYDITDCGESILKDAQVWSIWKLRKKLLWMLKYWLLDKTFVCHMYAICIPAGAQKPISLQLKQQPGSGCSGSHCLLYLRDQLDVTKSYQNVLER